MSDVGEVKSQSVTTLEAEAQRLAMRAMAPLRTVRIAQEARFETRQSLAAIRRSKAKF